MNNVYPCPHMNPEFHMNSPDAADKLHFEQRFSRFVIYYFVLLVLHLLVSNVFSVLFFILCWLDTPKLSIAIVAKHVFII